MKKGEVAWLFFGKQELMYGLIVFLEYHIDSIIHGGSDQAWRLTGFYGEPNTSLRRILVLGVRDGIC